MKSEGNRDRFGLLGKNIAYSFSQRYFTEKFNTEKLIHCSYENFDIPSISALKNILKQSHLSGLNVTIPYKQEVIPFLDRLSLTAKEIGAVNTIKIEKDGSLTGHNTDCIGFEKTVRPYHKEHRKALVLGTGGASKAIVYSLNSLNIKHQYVSRSKSNHSITYKELNKYFLSEYTMIINCTPLGTYPKVDQMPDLDYNGITAKHLLYDLIYNPGETKFLSEGKKRGATIVNGYQMLVEQAEAAWSIWLM